MCLACQVQAPIHPNIHLPLCDVTKGIAAFIQIVTLQVVRIHPLRIKLLVFVSSYFVMAQKAHALARAELSCDYYIFQNMQSW